MNTLAAYRAVTTVLGPMLPLYLAARRARGKEDRARFGERLGQAGATRPPGPPARLHAPSVGEAAPPPSLIHPPSRHRPAPKLLLNTGTGTSARLPETPPPAGHAPPPF